MRIWVASLLWLASIGLCLTSQSPRLAADPPAIVIKPMRPGDSPDKEPLDKNGYIIIRPNGKVSTTTQVGVPPTPSTSPTSPTGSTQAPGVLNVPPPEASAVADPGKDDKPLFDYWFAVGIEGQRAGYVNWAASQKMHNEKPYVHGKRLLNLTISRFGQASNQVGEENTVETPPGTVLIATMRQTLGKDQSLALTGTVSDDGKKLKVKRDGNAIAGGESEIPWPEGVVGLAREPRLFKELNLKMGESFDYPSYIASVNWVVKTTITFDGEESKVLWPNTPARKVLRFVTKPAPIGKIKLPASTTWVDAQTFEPLLMETDFLALGGRLSFLRTTKEVATSPITRTVEVFNAQSIRLNREIPGIHSKGAVVYKVSIPRDDEPETVFATDPRQEIKNLDTKSRTFELRVTARHGPEKNATPVPAADKEFMESNYFINWDNDLVKAHAAKAIAGLPANAGAWEKAVAVERWVKMNMKAFEFTQALATADNVAKTLSGDCTEYAMLAAAMCRAVKVPSRTALGIVYAPKDGKAFMAFHMWFEVFADNQWLPLDATLGLGGVGPGHIKISDNSWYEEKTLAPLIPVLRALMVKPNLEVLKVEP